MIYNFIIKVNILIRISNNNYSYFLIIDLVANAASARRGYPNMGISACFGGPLFSNYSFHSLSEYNHKSDWFSLQTFFSELVSHSHSNV